MSIADEIRRINPRSAVFLFSGGKDSSLALLLTRDLMKELKDELHMRGVYILYVYITGNTHPLNAYASATVMEWHRKHYGFEPIYKCRNKLFQENMIKYGLWTGKGRWCHAEFKGDIFREIERKMPRPLICIDGMSPSDSKYREENIDKEIQFVKTAGGTEYWAWHPLFSVNMSPEEKLEILRKHEEFRPIVELYERFGESMNCVVCPYFSRKEMLRIHSAENLRILHYFAEECLGSDQWKKYFKTLTVEPLNEML
jgi:3'-phosphoadenosine 5'-phosphosulfate sulfotransferase (PAPS reductase)/FAD synthetase